VKERPWRYLEGAFGSSTKTWTDVLEVKSDGSSGGSLRWVICNDGRQICAGCDTARGGYLQASFYISESPLSVKATPRCAQISERQQSSEVLINRKPASVLV